MGVTELIVGAYQVDKGKKAMKALEAAGVQPLSPEYQRMQRLAEQLANQGFSYQEIAGYLNKQLSASNAMFAASRNAAGGNLAQAFNAIRSLDTNDANANMAMKDAELRRGNTDRLFNTYQVLQNQKNANLERYDRQMAAAQGIAAAGAANVTTGITDIKNTVLGSVFGGGGDTGDSQFQNPSVTGGGSGSGGSGGGAVGGLFGSFGM